MVDFRKIIRFGGNSLIISLPKDWTKRHNINPGDSVRLEQVQDVIVVSPSSSTETIKKKECVHHIDGDNIMIIKRKILSAYLNNYDIITLKGKQIATKNKAIRKAVNQLMALEIIEETTTTIQAKSYVHMQDIHITQLIRKIDAILKSMIQDLISSTKNPLAYEGMDIAKNLSERDGDVNRLSFLVMKTIKHVLEYPHLHNVTIKQENILDVWDAVQTLEKIGDHIKRLARLVPLLEKNEALALITIIEKVTEHYDAIMKARYKKDFATIHDLASKRVLFTAAFDTYQEQHEHSVNVAKSIRFARELFHWVDKLTAVFD